VFYAPLRLSGPVICFHKFITHEAGGGPKEAKKGLQKTNEGLQKTKWGVWRGVGGVLLWVGGAEVALHTFYFPAIYFFPETTHRTLFFQVSGRLFIVHSTFIRHKFVIHSTFIQHSFATFIRHSFIMIHSTFNRHSFNIHSTFIRHTLNIP
jgi:hypothetical protein